MIESTAAAALNQLSTGTLVANDIANHTDATAKTMGYQANVMNPEGATGGGTGSFATAIGTGMAANAGGLLGAATHQDASSVTQSAIGSNVQIAAGSTSGDLSRSPSTSSHPLTNTFDAQQMQNDLQIQQVGSQAVGQVGGMVSDSLAASGLDAFKEGGYGRVLMETAGNAGVAALGHGSIGGSALATSAAGFGNLVTLPAAAGIAEAIAPNDRDAQYAIANTIETAASAGLGAAGGAVGGNSSVDAISGAGAASNVAQYNASAEMAMQYAAGLAVSAGTAEILAPAAAAAVLVAGGYEVYNYVAEHRDNVSINAVPAGPSSSTTMGDRSSSSAQMTASPDASEPTILVTPSPEQTNGYTEEFPIHDQQASDHVIADPIHDDKTSFDLPGFEAQEASKQDNILADPIPRQLTAADLISMSTTTLEDLASGKVTVDATSSKTIIVDSKGNALVGNWSATKKLTPPENAFGHAVKHRSEFPAYSSDSEYVERAQNSVANPPDNVLTKTRGNGDILLYDPESNTFAVKTGSGVPKIMFRPNNVIDYWNRQ